MSASRISVHGTAIRRRRRTRFLLPSTISLRPSIAEILRTTQCVPGTILLVESSWLDIAVTADSRAVRLLLGDGELCCQALLVGKLHSALDRGRIYAGCYVRLNKFELRTYVSDGEDSACLVVHDLVGIGICQEYVDMLRAHRRRQEAGSGVTRPTIVPKSILRKPKKQVDHDAIAKSGKSSDEEDYFETMHVSPTKATQRRREINAAHVAASPNHISQAQVADDLSRPRKLTPLKAIPSLPFKQNWAMNVLAVVVSLSDLEPSNLPPNHNQRTARLADPSTDKQVLLTVFLEPENFTPKVGAVVLLLGVKNHRFDGGCLKKYVSDKPATGTWWIEEPSLDWCDGADLKNWWDTRSLQGEEVHPSNTPTPGL